jgi:hypothetical protein
MTLPMLRPRALYQVLYVSCFTSGKKQTTNSPQVSTKINNPNRPPVREIVGISCKIPAISIDDCLSHGTVSRAKGIICAMQDIPWWRDLRYPRISAKSRDLRSCSRGDRRLISAQAMDAGDLKTYSSVCVPV